MDPSNKAPRVADLRAAVNTPPRAGCPKPGPRPDAAPPKSGIPAIKELTLAGKGVT